MNFEKFKDGLKDVKKLSEGWRGLIYTAIWNGQRVSVKVARNAEKLEALKKEIRILQKLKGKKGFPQILFWGEDFFLYRFVEGIPFGKIQEGTHNRKQALKEVLKLAYELDLLGIDHGELTRIDKNVLVNESGEVFLLDFERGSERGKRRNVTQFLQVLRREGILSHEEAVNFGREYRKNSEAVFKVLMDKIN